MTNKMIILLESVKLMKDGILQGTGEKITVTLKDGTEKVFEIPEEIHTFSVWKARGFSVKKGQHAIAAFHVWVPCSVKKSAETGSENAENADTKLCFKKSYFFKADQVEPIRKSGAA